MTTPLQYIAHRIRVDPRTGCWEWQLRTQKGYGKMAYAGEDWLVHRFTFHNFKAFLPKASVVHHVCANRGCCNPEHLQAVSHHDNAAEMLGRRYYEEELTLLRELVESLRNEITHLTAELDSVAEPKELDQ